MIKEYKGVLLCACSILVNLISGFLIIIGAYSLNKVLVYIALIILFIGMLSMLYGLYLIYKKYKESKK